METNYYQRFSGIERLYGKETFKKISECKMIVIGIGGVGSWCAEALIRSGVQNLTLVDLDEICVTNTNRQLHALSHTVGQSKVGVIKERLLAINPDASIDAVEDFLTESNLEEILSGDFDVVIDAIDSLKNKALMANYCYQKKLKLVTVGGAGGKKNPSLIRSGDLSESTQDNLLKRLKKKLRVDFGLPRTGNMNIACIYSTERALYPNEKGEVCFKKDLKDKDNTKLDCATGMGTATFATGSFGFAAAYKALELLSD